MKEQGGLTPEMMPDWYEAAIAALDFPLGWKPGSNPGAWKKRGREAYRALLLEDPRPIDPEPRVLGVEKRGSYTVSLISLAMGPFRRARAYLALPEGKGPFPAALLLHDHGAFFEIGKEKMIRPLAGDPKAAMSADWMDKKLWRRLAWR